MKIAVIGFGQRKVIAIVKCVLEESVVATAMLNHDLYSGLVPIEMTKPIKHKPTYDKMRGYDKIGSPRHGHASFTMKWHKI